jgi:hypothetical protein
VTTSHQLETVVYEPAELAERTIAELLGARRFTELRRSLVDGVLGSQSVFICDRDRKWSSAVIALMRSGGVRVHAPNGKRTCGAVRPLHQARVFKPVDSAWRAAPAAQRG